MQRYAAPFVNSIGPAAPANGQEMNLKQQAYCGPAVLSMSTVLVVFPASLSLHCTHPRLA